MLYNLDLDPSENNNVAKDNPEIIDQLTILVKDHLENMTYHRNMYINKSKKQEMPDWAK